MAARSVARRSLGGVQRGHRAQVMRWAQKQPQHVQGARTFVTTEGPGEVLPDPLPFKVRDLAGRDSPRVRVTHLGGLTERRVSLFCIAWLTGDAVQ